MIDLLKNPETWRLLVELILIPMLLSGDQIGLVRVLNFLKERFALSGRELWGFPVMRLAAGVAAVLAAGLVAFADRMFTGSALDPQMFVGIILAFLTLSQAWYKKIESVVDLQRAIQ